MMEFCGDCHDKTDFGLGFDIGADFEFTPQQPGSLRLELTTWGTGWHLPQELRVRPAATGYVPGATREN